MRNAQRDEDIQSDATDVLNQGSTDEDDEYNYTLASPTRIASAGRVQGEADDDDDFIEIMDQEATEQRGGASPTRGTTQGRPRRLPFGAGGGDSGDDGDDDHDSDGNSDERGDYSTSELDSEDEEHVRRAKKRRMALGKNKLKDPVEFSRGMDPEEWLRDFQRNHEGNGGYTSGILVRIKTFLGKPEQRWHALWEKRTASSMQTWRFYKRDFMKEFLDPQRLQNVRRKIQRLRMLPDQKVADYAAYARQLFSEDHGPDSYSEAWKVFSFCNGLQPEALKVKMEEQLPNTLEEACRRAIFFASNPFYRMQKNRIDAGSDKKHGRGGDARLDKRGRDFLRGKAGGKSGEDKRRDFRKGDRRNSGDGGNATKNGGNHGKPKNLDEVECFYCHKFGHYANKCPDKAKDQMKSGN